MILAKDYSSIGEENKIKILVDGGGHPKWNTHPWRNTHLWRERDKRGSMYGTHMEREQDQ